MPGLTTIRFAFLTATSGSPETLQQRAGCANQQDMVALALAYYAYYAKGVHGSGDELVSVDRRSQEAEELNDEPTPAHHKKETLEASVDGDFLDKLTALTDNGLPADTLSRALVLLEDICNAHDKGYEIGLMNENESEITILNFSNGLGPSPGLPPPKHRLH